MTLDFILKTATIALVVCLLAYYIPGLVLRAIKDFRNRHKP